jgi:two-component system CheB/CheR fusion protein
MSSRDPVELDARILILAPLGKDARLIEGVLHEAGFPCLVCDGGATLLREAADGCAVLLVAEEAMVVKLQADLGVLLAAQPEWSDLPLLLLAGTGAASPTVRRVLERFSNVTVIERPVRVAALVSAVRVGSRARQRQYEIRGRMEAQALLSAIVTSSDDAIVSTDLTGTITSWNGGAERLFGYTADEALGRPVTMLIPAERIDEKRFVLDDIPHGRRLVNHDSIRLRKDGTRVPVALTLSPIVDARGRIVGASKIVRDITAQRRGEQALRASEEALKEADRRKNEFLATLAHELRNPLAPIRNSLGLMAYAESSPRQLAYVKQVLDRQVNHMVRLIDDLTEVSRITLGKIALQRECVELRSVVESAIETSQPILESGHHELTVDLGDDDLSVNGDRVRLAQVFANLLNNAAKYSEDGSPVWLSMRRDRDDAVVTVRDAGIGIAPEMLPRVFEMFRQLDSSPHRRHGGLGIGLTLVQNLVELHGGTVAATSGGAGEGSEFTVRLPLAVSESAGESPAGDAEIRLPRLRVLVVDDNRDAAESSSLLLEVLGAETHVANDGREALVALETFPADLVLLDLGMPGMDGFEVARRIRSDPAHRDLKLVAVTGWGQEEDRLRSREAGFDDHLVKPTGVEALRAVMAGVGSPRDVVRNGHAPGT